MKTFVKCTVCDAEISNTCMFATQKRVIDGEEHVFCCERCFAVHQKNGESATSRTRENPKR